MKRSFCLMMAMLVGVSCAGVPTPSHGINVILMGEDKHREAIPRDHRVFRKVLDALSNELGDGGYRVLDETALTLDNFKQGRKNRTDAEIIDIARSIKRPPIDVVVIFEIYPDRERKAYTTKLDVEVMGRLSGSPRVRDWEISERTYLSLRMLRQIATRIVLDDTSETVRKYLRAR